MKAAAKAGIIIYLSSFPAFAEDSIKVEIFSNCRKAEKAFEELPREEVHETLEYLVRVLALNATAPDITGVVLLPPTYNKGSELGQPALWQNIDAGREYEAKKCALQLLEMAGPEALFAVPELAEVYSEENLRDEISIGIEEVAANIGEKANLAGIVPTELGIGKVCHLLSGARPLVAQNFLLEFKEEALPQVLHSISQAPVEDIPPLLHLIHQMDNPENKIFDTLSAIFPRLESEQQDRLLSLFSAPRACASDERIESLSRCLNLHADFVGLQVPQNLRPDCWVQSTGNLPNTETEKKHISQKTAVSVLSKSQEKLIRKKLVSDTRLNTLIRYQGNNVSSLLEQKELLSLLSKLPCDKLEIQSLVIEGLIGSQGLVDDDKNALFKQMALCLQNVPPEVSQIWFPQIPIDIINTSFLSQESVENAQMSRLLEILEERLLNGPKEQIAPYITYLLQSATRDSRLRALSFLKKVKEKGECEYLPLVKKISESAADDDSLFTQSLIMRARCDDPSYDWSTFVKDLLKDAEKSNPDPSRLEVIDYLRSDIVAPEILAALESGSQEKIIGASRVGAALGKRGFALVASLWELRNSDIPSIRYEVTLALLQINPLNPDLQMKVRNILVNRFYQEALMRDIDWQKTVAVFELEKSGVGVLRRLRLRGLERKGP